MANLSTQQPKKRFTNADLAAMIIDLDHKFTGLDQKFTGQFNGLDQKFTGKFDSLEGKFNTLDRKFTGQISNLDHKLTGQINNLDRKFTGQINNLARAYLELRAALTDTEKRLTHEIQRSQNEVVAVICDVIDISSQANDRLDKRVTKLEHAVFGAKL